MVHAHNCTKNSSTGYSPYYLLFGREPRLPVDVLLGKREDKAEFDHNKYAQSWKQQMTEAYKIAKEKSQNRKIIDKKRWDAKPLLSRLEVGDRVLVRNVREKGGPGKLRSFWEQCIYVVTSLKGEHGVVYEVREDGNRTSKPRVLHRNMLLPVGDDFQLEQHTNE